MSPHSLSTTFSPPLPLPSGGSLWLCLPPGSTLRPTQGTISVRWAPQPCGHALHTPPMTLLTAGEPLAWSGTAQAIWVQLYNTTHEPAAVQLEEAAPTPTLWPKIWRELRAALRRSGNAARELPSRRSAWHGAR